MSTARFRKLLLCTASVFAVLAPAGLAAAACPSRPLPPCRPVAFTGSVGNHLSGCVTANPPACRTQRGDRGRRGLRGITGKTGAAGRTGHAGTIGTSGARGAQGRSGDAGPAGTTGAVGDAGAIGGAGRDGLQGVQGTTGAAGAAGPAGPPGLAAAQGPTGPEGPQGAPGTDGTDGASGPTGTTGPAGAVGDTGATGPASSGLGEYAYIYNLTPEVVAIEADVPFDSNGVLSPGITHAPGASEIAFTTAGTYKVTFTLSGTEPNQTALFLNGVVVPGTVYGSGAGTQLTTGLAIFTIGSSDVLTLRNHSSSAAVGLASNVGGTQANANASVAIEKLD